MHTFILWVFFVVRLVISFLVVAGLYEGEMARHLSGYLVWGRCQATAMPIRIRPISGHVCGLELTDDTDHPSITDTAALQAAGRDYTQKLEHILHFQ